uniref:Uncharacterized protein n=1 Tax=Rhizophora mucronata TaxID=61149 RepID=A0A2P2NSC1_RHIMU
MNGAMLFTYLLIILIFPFTMNMNICKLSRHSQVHKYMANSNKLFTCCLQL